MVYQEDHIGKVIVNYFQELLKAIEGDREAIVMYALSRMVNDEMNEKLIMISTASDIKEEVFSIHADKAPRPDGFSESFFRTNWDTIGNGIVVEIQDFFFISDSLPPKINETHIKLIPRIPIPQRVTEYITHSALERLL